MTKFPFCTFLGGKSRQKKYFFEDASDKMLTNDCFGTNLAVKFTVIIIFFSQWPHLPYTTSSLEKS